MHISFINIFNKIYQQIIKTIVLSHKNKNNNNYNNKNLYQLDSNFALIIKIKSLDQCVWTIIVKRRFYAISVNCITVIILLIL
jgi:hypothetical protein